MTRSQDRQLRSNKKTALYKGIEYQEKRSTPKRKQSSQTRAKTNEIKKTAKSQVAKPAKNLSKNESKPRQIKKKIEEKVKAKKEDTVKT